MKYYIDEQLLRKYYLEDKLSVEECAKKFNCSSMPIRRAIREYNIPKRNISESLKEIFKDKTNHPKYGWKTPKEVKDKISNSQPYKGTNHQTNTGRTQFKVGRETTPAMRESSSIVSKRMWEENPDYLPSCNRKLWREDYERLCSTRARGENNGNWNENVEFYRRARNWLNCVYEWHYKIFERDDYTCWICGRRGEILNAHHTYPFNQIIEDFVNKYGEDMERLKLYYPFITLENGITLCEKCHKELHWGK